MGTPRQPSTIGHDAFIKNACRSLRKKALIYHKKKGEEEVENSFRAAGLGGENLTP